MSDNTKHWLMTIVTMLAIAILVLALTTAMVAI